MKRFSFNLARHFVGDIGSPIRSKREALIVLMKCIKLMLLGDLVPADRKVGELVLIVSKRSRVFLFAEGKYFSLAFPFFVNGQSGALTFSTKHVASVDSKITSDVISVLSSSEAFENLGAWEVAEAVMEIDHAHPSFGIFVLGLLMYEDGYVRYDCDPKNADGEVHPLHHYDFFYSSAATCKVGLRSGIGNSDMEEFLLPEAACKFIETPSQKVGG